jgi:hypothetical protein
MGKYLIMKQAEMRRRWGKPGPSNANLQVVSSASKNEPKASTKDRKRAEPTQLQPHSQLLQSPVVSQEPAYIESCLPLTIELAERYRKRLGSKLKEFPKSWPFADRLLVALEPSFKNDVHGYHSMNKLGTSAMFKEHQLEHLDKDLERKLRELLK